MPARSLHLLSIQDRMADTMLVVLFGASLPLCILSLARVVELGWIPAMSLHVVLVAWIGLTAALRRRLPLVAKGATLVAFFVLIGVGTVLTNHESIYGAPYFLIAVMTAMTFFGLREAALLMLATTGFELAYELAVPGPLRLHSLLLILSSPAIGLVAIYIVGTTHNALSELVARLQEQNQHLDDAREEALAATRAKSEFLATMSHELRTPMSGILGATGLLQREALSPKQRGYADLVETSASSLLGVLNDILDLSKIEAGKLLLERVPVDLADLLEELRALMAINAEARGTRLHLGLPTAPLPRVVSDPLRLRQILLNLLGNAIKFTDKGDIFVEVDVLGRSPATIDLRFAVRDTGIGIPEDRLPKLFRTFEQVDASISRKYGGTGLGLSISKHLVRLMGGEIGVESAAGVGSTFWFVLRLPITTDAATSEAAPLAAPPADRGDRHSRGRRILVVEDNPINVLVATSILANLGYAEVESVSDGRSALRRLAAADYDLVLMDMQMPELDGLETTALIRRAEGGVRDPAVPVIALTANAMRGDDERCLHAGMDGYLSKPIDVEALAAALARWLPPPPASASPTTAA